MLGSGSNNSGESINGVEETDTPVLSPSSFCRDFIRGCCTRDNCRYIHDLPPKSFLKELFRFCHDFQNKGCLRFNCKFIHCTTEDEEKFLSTGIFPRDVRETISQTNVRSTCTTNDCKLVHKQDASVNENTPKLNVPPPPFHSHPPPFRDENCPPEAKFGRFTFDNNGVEMPCVSPSYMCPNCEKSNHKVKLLHDNISVLLKKVTDLTEKNVQLTSMNEFLLEQTASLRSDQSCVITSRHGSSAPVSLATVSMTPVVSLAGAIPALVPAAATPNLALAPAASRAQLLTPAPQLLTVSTTPQLVGNSGTLIVTSAGAQQLMQVSDSGTLMGGGQTVVAVTPAQLTLAPPGQQLMSNTSQAAVQQLVQQSAQQLVQPQLASQHQAQQFAAAQQSVQHLAAARQSAQHLAAAAQQSAQQLAAAAQQSAQQLAAQQSAQQLAAQQTAQQQLVPPAQQLVHQTSTQQITISNTSQAMALPSSPAQSITFPMISQNILPH
ncbi:Zinc finger CCCH domain-containing protein 10 [Eumeta japonica]|uniref:Zinc finger CCCH domain-containing protein 10 n=1 Tax=Eumeta variegata TaxID=151549 RepID=A0A4C1TVM8_EUMVA|nr:Zinc finger CCCH domain-containing protein 10 [Eumeta japonica]